MLFSHWFTHFNVGIISFQKYGKEKYYRNSMGTRVTLSDLDVSPVSFKSGDTNTYMYIKNIKKVHK